MICGATVTPGEWCEKPVGHEPPCGRGSRVPPAFPYRWRVRARLAERLGQRCRVLVRGSMNSALVEFERDAKRYVTSRNYLRKDTKEPGANIPRRSE